MSELKRTQLYEIHVGRRLHGGFRRMGNARPISHGDRGGASVHPALLQPVRCVPHGAAVDRGAGAAGILQHVLSSNVAGLDLNMAQYCILPDEDGGAVDDAYLYRFEEERLLLVVNAANTEKDLMHLRPW